MQVLAHNRIERVDGPVRRQVEDALREAIVAGRFAQGERLVEARLCTRLGVSRPIVREALRQLVAEGLVVIVPHHGARVASITVADARQIYAVRAPLEGLAGSGFAVHAGARARRQLSAAVDDLAHAAARRAGARRLLAIKQRFYAVLLEHCGNRIVCETLERLNNRIGPLRALSLSRPGRLPQTVGELRRILDAIEARDPAAAQEACVRHVERAAEHALRALEARDRRSADADDQDTGMQQEEQSR